MVSVSGGSDSDIMVDLFERLGYPPGLVTYVWFDTGLEYEATKRHLCDLEKRYGIKIERYRAGMTVAQAVRKYGVPFISKEISEKIGRAQRKGFDWNSDLTYDKLMERYDKAKSFLKWWCAGVRETRFSVMANAGLKEFIQQNEPPAISNRCCDVVKKSLAKKAVKDVGATLDVVGVRRSEGGVRAMAYHTCFSEATDSKVAQFRPVFYFTDEDKKQYKEHCGLRYSDCYELWGFKRTGCACCPFGSGFEEELATVRLYEPKLYAAACRIFGPSYDYTRRYREFKENFKKEKRQERRRLKEYTATQERNVA